MITRDTGMVAERADLFISYVAEDSDTALQIAQGLEQAGYSTWFYGRDGLPGVSYLAWELQAIERAQVFLLLISPNSLASHQVDVEVAHAHEAGKPQMPVLIGIPHEEYQARKPIWNAAGATATSISVPPDGVGPILPRLVAGLAAMGIVPQGNRLASEVTTRYPYPLAATYARRLAAGAGREQAFQIHEGLADLVEALVTYLATIAAARYRRDMAALGREDADVEQDLQNLRSPTPGAWIALLNSALGLYGSSPDPLMRDLHAAFFQASHRNDAVSEAAIAIQEWLALPTRRRAPFSLQSVFELLELYRLGPQGWGSPGAVLPPAEYQVRVDVLRPALEAALGDLGVLVDYPLVCARGSGRGAEGPLRFYRGMGRDMVPETAADPSSRAWKGGHIFLCTSQAGRLEPYLDLHPVAVCDECPVCGGLTIFFPSTGRDQRLAYQSNSCGHTLGARQAVLRGHELQAFFSLDSAGSLLYLEALREVLGAGEVSEDERRSLEFLAKTLNIGGALAETLEADVRDESDTGPGPAGPAGRASGEGPGAPSEPLASEPLASEPLANDPVAPDAGPIAGTAPGSAPESPRAAGNPFVLLWREATDVPVLEVALFGTPTHALVVDEDGAVYVRSEARKLVYRERADGRVLRVAAAGDRVAVTTWNGQLAVFGDREMAWQTDLASPVCAIGVGQGRLRLLAGTWDGQVVAFQANGDRLWSARFDDGIAALAVSPSGVELAVGTLAGQLAILDENGERVWLRDMHAPIVRLAFARHRHAIVAATRHLLTQIDIDNQGTVWDSAFERRIDDFALVGDQSRLAVATNRGRLQLFAGNGELHGRAEHEIPELAQLLAFPLPAGEQMPLALSRRHGLLFLDGRGQACGEEGPVATCAAVSDSGRRVILGSAEGVSLYRLAKPDLKMTLAPVGDLVQGRYTRLRISLRNSGELAAREIGLALEGPVECDPKGLTTELEPGGMATSEEHSIRFTASGAVPLSGRLSYTDDWGIRHDSQVRHVWDVAAKDT